MCPDNCVSINQCRSFIINSPENKTHINKQINVYNLPYKTEEYVICNLSVPIDSNNMEIFYKTILNKISVKHKCDVFIRDVIGDGFCLERS